MNFILKIVLVLQSHSVVIVFYLQRYVYKLDHIRVMQ